MTTCSRQSVQVHPSKEGRLFHYRQVHRCPVRTYEGRSYPVFLQMASLFPASGKFFVPALRPCRRAPSRKNFWCVLPSPALRANLVRVKEAPGNAGEPRQSRSLRGPRENLGGYGGDRSACPALVEKPDPAYASRFQRWHMPARRKNHRRSAAHVTAPSLGQRPSLFAGKRQRGRETAFPFGR